MTKSPPRPVVPGYTVTVLTPFGRETYQVWLSEGPSGWNARIVTLPNRIWARPGAQEALRFHAATAAEAEAAAKRHIEQECSRFGRRFATLSEQAPTPGGPSSAPTAGTPSSGKRIETAKRFPRRLLLRFGTGLPSLPAVTGNLSEGGLFVVTDRPPEPGALVRIDLRFPDGPTYLSADVVWQRLERQMGYSLGFGARIHDRPIEYLLRLRALVSES